MPRSTGSRRLCAESVYAVLFLFVDSPPCKCILFSKEETRDALNKIKEKPECNEIYRPPPEPDMGPLTMEEHAFLGSKVQSFTPQGKAPPDFNELKGQSSLGISRLSARKEARLHAFLKANGGFALRHTQDLGNCLYAAVLRGTDCKREFTTMHLRRMLVWMVSQYPSFFSRYLSRPLGLVYGQDRLSKKELAKREKEGTISAKDLHDEKLPGPLSLYQFMKLVATDGVWGDENILHIISCLWQISITILDADTLGEIRIRHNMRIARVDLVVVFVGGDHYLGCGTQV